MLSVQNVSFGYQSTLVLRDCSFEVKKGEILGVLGSSGTGKTTLLKILAGLITPMRGRILLEGTDIEVLKQKPKQFYRKTTLCFQKNGLFDAFSVKDNLLLPLVSLSKSEPHDDAIKNALFEVGLEGTLHQSVGSLSGGMQKRLAIARALVSRPEVILFDDPAAGLDPITCDSILELIQKTVATHHCTALIATAIPREVEKICHRIFTLGETSA